jgi:hypothetical protein
VHVHQFVRVCACACSAGAAKEHAFFKRSTFDVSKVDETFCLQARVPDEDDTDGVESCPTKYEPKNNTQVISERNRFGS